MRSNYKRIADCITEIKLKNTDGAISSLKGININKQFMPSVANIIGTDLSKYKVVKMNQLAFNPMHVGRDEVLPISMLEDKEPIIVSPAYKVFEVTDEKEILPEYIMMWCRRTEFDRKAWFMTDNTVRGGLSWSDFCDTELPVPSIKKQREIVNEYNVVNNNISLNKQLTKRLEDAAQAIYKQWFVDFEFPISKEYAQSISKPELEGKAYKSSGGAMKYCKEIDEDIPLNWDYAALSSQAEIVMGQSPSGEYLSTSPTGTVFYQGRADFNFRYPSERIYTSLVKRRAQSKDVLMTVRAPVGNINIASQECAIGRGVAAIRDKCGVNSFIHYSLQNLSRLFSITDGEGTIFGSINKDELNELSVIKPDMDTKKQFNKMVSHIDHAIEVAEKKLISLRTMRNLINTKMSKT